MARRKKEVIVRFDTMGNALPPGISQRKDGRYIWRFSHNGITYKPVYDWDLERLKKIRIVEMAKIIQGDFEEPSSVTLNQYFTYYMETYRKGDMKAVSYENMLNNWRWYIQNGIGKKKIQKLKRADFINQYRILQTRKNPIAWSTVTRVHSMVYNVLEQARLEDIILRNPAEKVLKDTPKLSDEKEREALEPSVVKKFFEYISAHRHYKYHKNFFTVLFGTGMRVGECCALCKEDVNFEEGYFMIYKTLFYRKLDDEGRKKWVGGTKSRSGTRTIPLLSGVKAAIEDQLQYNEETNIKCKEAVEVVHEVGDVAELADRYRTFVFMTQDGTAYTPDYVTQIIKKIVRSYNREEERKAKGEKRKAELLPEFSAHYTRHTFATRAQEQNVSTDHISKWLGHSKTKDGESSVTKGYIHEKWEKGWTNLVKDVGLLEKMIIN